MPEELSLRTQIDIATQYSELKRTDILARWLGKVSDMTFGNNPPAAPYQGPQEYMSAARSFLETRLESSYLIPGNFLESVKSSEGVKTNERHWRMSHIRELKEVATANRMGIMHLDGQYGDVFRHTVFAFVYLPHTMCANEYRRGIADALFGLPKNSQTARAALAAGRLTAAQLYEVADKVESLPSAMPLPHFNALPRLDQSAIVRGIGQECLAYWRIIARYTNQIQRQQMPDNRRVALLYRPLQKLEAVLGVTNDPITVLQEYTATDSAFDERYTKLSLSATGLSKEKTDDEVIQSLQPGDTFELSAQDEVMSKDELSRAVNVFIDALAVKMQKENPGIGLGHWNVERTDIVAVLTKKFNGKIKHVRMALLEVSDDFIKQRIKAVSADTSTVYRIAVLADFASTGKPAIPVSADMALYIRRPEGCKPTIYKTSAKKLTGADAVEALLQESAQIAAEHGRQPVRARRVASGERNVYQDEPSKLVIG